MARCCGLSQHYFCILLFSCGCFRATHAIYILHICIFHFQVSISDFFLGGQRPPNCLSLDIDFRAKVRVCGNCGRATLDKDTGQTSFEVGIVVPLRPRVEPAIHTRGSRVNCQPPVASNRRAGPPTTPCGRVCERPKWRTRAECAQVV